MEENTQLFDIFAFSYALEKTGSVEKVHKGMETHRSPSVLKRFFEGWHGDLYRAYFIHVCREHRDHVYEILG